MELLIDPKCVSSPSANVGISRMGRVVHNMLSLSAGFTHQPAPRIKKRSGVCGGVACVAGTRIPVWGLVVAQRRGDSLGDILENYPSLSRVDLAAAFRYAKLNRREIEQNIRENLLR